MTKESYIENNKALMKKWKERVGACEGKVSFVEDGIISPDDWFSAEEDEKRILILLKEAYDRENQHLIWSLPKWICHEKCMLCCDKDCSCCNKKCADCWVTGSSYNRVAEWTHGILTDSELCDPWLGANSRSTNEYGKARESYLRKIAIVNIKKSEGQHVSSTQDLMGVLKEDAGLLREQIDLIKPTLIICGGTYNYLRMIYDDLTILENCRNGHTRTGNYKVIAAYHPNARKKREELYQIIRSNYLGLMNNQTE